jgi:hypothetical protein
MRLLRILTEIFFIAAAIAGLVFTLILCRSTQIGDRESARFTPAEQEKLEEFRAEQREPPKP